MLLETRHLSKAFGGSTVLDDISLDFPDSEVTVILGPSGCGKTTLLRILSGLLVPDSGSIEPSPRDFSSSFVFQEPRLLPRSTCRENVAYGLESRFALDKALEAAGEFLSLVGLQESTERYPHELSGGMNQRVSLARAFAYPSDSLFMDEPFQSLDLGTRIGIMDSFLALWKRDPKTCVFVTHDIQEALYLGDRIIVLSSRPSRAIKTIDTGFGHACRIFGDSAMAEAERELYELALSSSCLGGKQ